MLELLGMAERKFYRAGLTMQGAKLQEAGRMLPTMLHVIGGMEPQEQERYRGIIEGMQQALAQLPAQPDRATFRETCHLCRDLMKLAEENLQKEKCRKLIVFLPYKASMWDSLESIWMAAYKDREHCQTMVIPIPYGDRNPDGTAAAWHYEIDQYPKYVPVIDHRSVDLEKLHPEVIFIHNPYDNYNAVTSVDMKYYTKNLKQWTDDLIYVPYFVVGKTIAEHFCQTPGVVNADHVIVQDENIKEQYEKYYPGGNPPEGKFLALGSPKFDRILGKTKADYPLPPEWQRIIGGRRAVLYNTSVTAMINHPDDYCKKIRSVLNYFKNAKDIVLWWRPHPLLAATFQSMSPEHYRDYQSIVAQYKKEAWGIYDDTPDMDRAIVCTDAYYGDGSSLVTLYKATGKPVIYQLVDRMSFDPPQIPSVLDFTDAVFTGKTIRFSAWNVNGWFEYNRETGETKLLKLFQDGDQLLTRRYLYFATVRYQDDLYFLPTNAPSIKIYHTHSGTWEDIPYQEDLKGRSPYFCIAFCKDSVIWFLPYGARTIMSFDMRTKEKKYYSEWSVELEDSLKEINLPFGQGTLYHNQIYFSILSMPKMVVFDTIHKTYQITSLPLDADEAVSVIYAGKDDLWMYTTKDRLLQYRDSALLKIYTDVLGEYVAGGTIVQVENQLWVFALKKDSCGIVDLQKGTVEPWPKYLGGKTKTNYPRAVFVDNQIQLFPNYAGEGGPIIQINPRTHQIAMQSIPISKEYEKTFHNAFIEGSAFYGYESQLAIPLHAYVAAYPLVNELTADTGRLAGPAIYTDLIRNGI